MLTLNLILCACFMILMIVNIYGIHRNKKREQENTIIGASLEHIVCDTQDQLLKNQKLIEKAKSDVSRAQALLRDLPFDSAPQESFDPTREIDSPAMLSTLLTVLVKKYGAARLGMADFSSLDDEYISVYIDTKTQEIILAISSDVGSEPPLGVFGSGNSDDTFH